MSAVVPSARPAPASRWADACYAALRLAGWLATSMAIVSALWVLFFVMLGEFTFAGAVLHLDNFAARYVAADPERRAAFEAQFWIASAVLFLVVGVLRRHALRDLIPQSKETADGQV
ncbi:hypothetical protein [Croceicoccus naphthovorans]|uniref:Membrane protein n=1 Tax=Croceicoccus naphthovorans TaxID=1348774 RepID=A0A0G3XL95_9SPHN|nr:hypothetical protein [Croceicoccus naphthovorans]AKM11997.1 membrane protein [Croceicoccus naphthovorans]EZP69605.1 putative inner membrane protein [Sphingomonas paucimobilis]MBB3991785.1 hypothetical protein [Croceicoccus naphthovorans]